MMEPGCFSTFSLDHHPQGEAVKRILAGAIHAVDPNEAVRRHLRREGSVLLLGVGDDVVRYDVSRMEKILVLAVGKAAPAMAQTTAGLLQGLPVQGLMVVKHPTESLPVGFEQITGGHPIPNAGSLDAGRKIEEFLSGCGPADLLVCLISGGGSALMTLPVPGVSLDDMQKLTSLLLSCGARIDEINILRRHLDRVKGGGIVRMAGPAQVAGLILSDVVGNPLETIASGPTVADPTRLASARQIIEKYALSADIPAAITSALAEGVETLKPGNAIFEHVHNILVGSNLLAAQAAMAQAAKEGFAAIFLGDAWQGEARMVAQELLDRLKQYEAPARPLCLVAGGETTVTLRGKGRGGRNMELALAGAQAIAGMDGCMLVTLATDGEDGPTDAAGAVVTPNTLGRGVSAGLYVDDYLKDNDSYHYFDALHDLLKPGPTGTNVNDLTFLFAF